MIIEIDSSKVKYSKTKNFTMRNEITFKCKREGSINGFFENEYVELHYDNGEKEKCLVSYSFDDSRDDGCDIVISKRLKKMNEEETEVRLLKIESMKHYKVRKYSIAKVEHLEEVVVKLPVCHEKWYENPMYKGIELVNNFNGSSVYFPKESVIIESEDNGDFNCFDWINDISLSYEFRNILDIELPVYITEYYLYNVKEKSSAEKKHLIDKLYKSEESNVSYENYYEAKSNFKKIVNGINDEISMVSVYPIYNFEIKDENRNIKIYFDKFLKIIIRNKIKIKKVIRPYSIDESDNVVRLSINSIKQIGIEEGDRIIIRNLIRDLSVSAKVLEMADFDEICQENRIKSKQDLNLYIGIPAHLRNELKLDYINSCVTIERDMYFLFRKHMNNQVESMVGTMISLLIIKEFIKNIFSEILLLFIIFLILLYLSFSSIREAIDKPK